MSEFNPGNHVVKLCLQGMSLEAQGKAEEASQCFLQAWNESTQNWEKFISAHFVARQQNNTSDKLKWLEMDLELALKINDDSVNSALPLLYSSIAQCQEDLQEFDKAKWNRDVAASLKEEVSHQGPFYHGTKADLKAGDLLTAGGPSNYKSDLTMNHIYFTALVHGAGLAAALAKGAGPERVYRVEPTGSFENDPNLTNKKFPGNPTRSFRSDAPLKIVGEVTDWEKQSPAHLQEMREKVSRNKGEIIN